MRSPAEAAMRDLQAPDLWMQRIVKSLVLTYSENSSGILYLHTNTRKVPAWIRQHHPVITVVDAGVDPFGWNTSGASSATTLINLNDLQALIDATVIAAAAETEVLTPSALILSSLTPLLQHHGVSQTLTFLQILSKRFSPVIVSVPTDGWNDPDMRSLEDLAHAVLYCNGGEAVWLHRGIREQDNLTREHLEYTIVRLPGQDARIDIQCAKEQAKDLLPVGDLVLSSTTDKRSKVQLKLEQEDAAPNQNGRPRIFMQDDDPDVADYDSDEPDDDLDI
jgi:hypothetical protein